MDDFFWTYTEEPHRTRRKQIIAAHPQVLKLTGPTAWTSVVVCVVVLLQTGIALALCNTNLHSLRFWILTYFLGATLSQNLFLANHEIAHNLAFKAPWANRLLALVANMPVGAPYVAAFRPYHLLHHQHLGKSEYDTDLPTRTEAHLLSSHIGKLFFCTFQILFYALRPGLVRQIPFTPFHAANVAAVVLYDLLLLYYGSWTSLVYLLSSTFLAGSLHPMAAHFIGEHYVLTTQQKAPKDPQTPETFSYYGPLNLLAYNVGLHNEHHDFPFIPWTRLWKLHKIAKEFYEPLPTCDSWLTTLPYFILGDFTLFHRVKRMSK